MEPAGDSIVLEEEIDPNYEPTEKEVHEYASWLGMDLETEQDLFWIAREGLKAPLPENWKPCKTTDTEEIYYFNFATGQSTWDHPCDEYYRKVYEDHKKKKTTGGRAGGGGDGDERKKKEKEDVAELLGKRSGKKKKVTTPKATTEPLGPPVLARGAALGDKKPLPGLGGGKLNRLSSGGLGSASSLRPVASLGRLKGEAKDDGDGAAPDDEDEDEEDAVEHKPSILSKPPLGNLLTKKPLPTTSSLSKADSKADLDELTTGFDQKKQKLVDDHARILRALEEEHEAKLSAQKKQSQKELEELQEQEEAKLKQRRKEFDKKIDDIENQYDRDESNLLRERKEKIKRLESDMEQTLSQTKQELERDQEKEIQRAQSRMDAKLEDLKVEHERQEKLLKQKLDGLSSAADAPREVETLKGELQRSEKLAAEAASGSETLRQALAAAEQRFSEATQQIEALRKQLDQAKGELARSQSQTAEPSAVRKEAIECSECPEKARRIAQLEVELTDEQQQLKAARDSLLDLERQRDSAQASLEIEKKKAAALTSAGGSADAELTALRQVEADLRHELKEMEARNGALTKEMNEWKYKCSTLEQQKTELVNAAAAAAKEAKKEDTGTAKASETIAVHEEELEGLRSEITDLQDQVAVLTKTNSQIKEQLLKESNEKKQLREQLDNALSDDSSRELSHKLEQQQRETESLQKRLQADIGARDQQLQELNEQLHGEQQAADQSKRRLETEVAKLGSENRKLAAEGTMLKRQMEERLNEVSQAGDAAEQQAEATVTKQKWEIEQLQSSLKLVTRDKEELTTRVQQLETELDVATQAKHQVELERDSEAARSKKKDTERDALQQKLAAVQEEMETQVEKARVGGSETADLRTQLNKLKFKEQATQEKLTLAEEELRALEAKAQSQQSEIERLAREMRAKTVQLEEKTNALRDAQGEMEVLNDQLSDAKRQLSEWRARAQGGAAGQNQAGGGGAAAGEVAELRLRASELDAKVESLTSEKMQLMEKQRAMAQKQLTSEASLRAMEAERDRLADECHSTAQESSKWKDRLDKKTKECEQLKVDLFSATSEKDLVEMALSKEKDEKRDVAAQKSQLEKTKKQLEATIESLTTQLSEVETSQGRTSMETQALQSKLKRLENELETMAREFRASQEEREALSAKVKQQTSDMAALETRIRLLRSESNEQNARAKASEDDTSRQTEAIKRLEMQLSERDARLRKESDEKEALSKQLTALRLEKQEVETDLLAMKRKSESVEARYKDHENTATRGDFQLKLRVQQLEAERDGMATGKDRAEQHFKSLEKELLHTKEELETAKNELETARTRIKALTLEKDEFQTALLQAQSSQATSRGVAYGGASAMGATGATADAMLVRLQLADVNKTELEHHLADVATQLELATRRCTLAEARCRDQGVELESLHVEIASLRSSMAKMHLSALETLPLVERLEYEHRKRTLKRDFSAQLRDFQEREEHAVMRQKARLRAQHEKQLEELADELDAKKQRRVEYEEQVSAQVLAQLRSERDAQAKEMRKQVERELLEEERVLMDRKERRLESVAASLRQEEDEARARQREHRQIRREQELAGKGVEDDGDTIADITMDRTERTHGKGDVSPGQLRSASVHKHHHSTRRSVSARKAKKPSQPDDDRSDSDGSASDGGVQQRQARKRGRRDTDARRSRSHHEAEIARWQQRLAEETALLDKARALVAGQKKQLKKQAETIKKDKLAWRHEWAAVGSDGGASGHRVAILQEMKEMIDHSAASWNTSVQQLRARDEWIERREAKLRKMRRALATLREKRRRSRSRSRSRGRNHRAVRFGSASSASSSSESNQAREDEGADSDAVLDKLARLDGELASDASDCFSSDDRWVATARTPSHAYGVDRDPAAYGAAPVSYRYPLSMAFADGGYRFADPVDALPPPSTRIYRSPPLSARTTASSSSLASSAGSRLSQRVWPTTAARLALSSRGSASASGHGASDAAVQRRIARWAHGREAMQHAATRQATWLSSLYQEVKAYGDTRAQASADAAVAAAAETMPTVDAS